MNKKLVVSGLSIAIAVSALASRPAHAMDNVYSLEAGYTKAEVVVVSDNDTVSTDTTTPANDPQKACKRGKCDTGKNDRPDKENKPSEPKEEKPNVPSDKPEKK